MLLFPSQLRHLVNPFYETDEDRVSISGNVYFDVDSLKSSDNGKIEFDKMSLDNNKNMLY